MVVAVADQRSVRVDQVGQVVLGCLVVGGEGEHGVNFEALSAEGAEQSRRVGGCESAAKADAASGSPMKLPTDLNNSV